MDEIIIFPSLASIIITYLVLRFCFRKDLQGKLKRDHHKPHELSRNGRLALGGMGLTSVVLLISSSLKQELGAPALASAALITIVISALRTRWPKEVVKHVSWSVVPLVAGLFVIVEALNGAKVLGWTERFFKHAALAPMALGKQVAGFGAALVSNLAYNLPVGFTSGLAVQNTSLNENIKRAVLIGIDLGPNLSVTGSLATILWLAAIRREGEHVSA